VRGVSADEEGLKRLLAVLDDAIDQQALPVQDQLRAALREGRTSLRFEASAAGPVVVVSVDACELAEINIRYLVD
jgi:hypothetical protein